MLRRSFLGISGTTILSFSVPREAVACLRRGHGKHARREIPAQIPAAYTPAPVRFAADIDLFFPKPRTEIVLHFPGADPFSLDSIRGSTYHSGTLSGSSHSPGRFTGQADATISTDLSPPPNGRVYPPSYPSVFMTYDTAVPQGKTGFHWTQESFCVVTGPYPDLNAPAAMNFRFAALNLTTKAVMFDQYISARKPNGQVSQQFTPLWNAPVTYSVSPGDNIRLAWIMSDFDYTGSTSWTGVMWFNTYLS